MMERDINDKMTEYSTEADQLRLDFQSSENTADEVGEKRFLSLGLTEQHSFAKRAQASREHSAAPRHATPRRAGGSQSKDRDILIQDNNR